MDFKLDPLTGDILIREGLQLVTGAEELAQRLTVGLTINLGEFFSHTNYGLPWLRNEELGNIDVQYFLGEGNTTVPYIVKEIDRYILSIDQVVKVVSTYNFNKSTRTLTYTPKITGEDGEVVDFPPYNLDI
jgi:hypothetical protein